MNLSPAEAFAASAAITRVEIAAQALASAHDTEAAKLALLEVRRLAVNAYGVITDAELKTREAALRQHEGRAA